LCCVSLYMRPETLGTTLVYKSLVALGTPAYSHTHSVFVILAFFWINRKGVQPGLKLFKFILSCSIFEFLMHGYFAL